MRKKRHKTKSITTKVAIKSIKTTLKQMLIEKQGKELVEETNQRPIQKKRNYVWKKVITKQVKGHLTMTGVHKSARIASNVRGIDVIESVNKDTEQQYVSSSDDEKRRSIRKPVTLKKKRKKITIDSAFSPPDISQQNSVPHTFLQASRNIQKRKGTI